MMTRIDLVSLCVLNHLEHVNGIDANIRNRKHVKDGNILTMIATNSNVS